MKVKRRFEMDFGAVVKICAFVLIAGMLIYSAKLLMDYNEHVREREQKKKQIEALELLREELEYEVECEFDRDYVIRLAREELGLVLPQEITYYFDYSSGDSSGD